MMVVNVAKSGNLENNMADAKLTDEEIRLLRVVLAHLAIKTRTGELGITHGLDRFVSAGVALKKAERETLDATAKKLGLSSGLATFEG